MIIKVTASDIELGRRCSSHRCPVALALGRISKCLVSVYTQDCWFKGQVRELPTSVRQFITAFDSGLDVPPFEFKL